MTGLLIPGKPADESPVVKASQSVLEPPALTAVRAGACVLEGPGTGEEAKG